MEFIDLKAQQNQLLIMVKLYVRTLIEELKSFRSWQIHNGSRS